MFLAYPLSRDDFKYRNILAFLVFFTLLFNGGLVPTYILMVKYLHIKNTIWAHIFPYMLTAFFVLLMRTFFQQLPKSFIDSAKLDGASELRILLQIIAPLSKPVLASVGLLSLLRYWNDTWWTGMLYIDDPDFKTLPQLLQEIMSSIQFLATQAASQNIKVDLSALPSETARMAICVLAIGPVILIFPFFQKYFVRGLTVGAIKG